MLVERFATTAEWMRACAEIDQFEDLHACISSGQFGIHFALKSRGDPDGLLHVGLHRSNALTGPTSGYYTGAR